MIDPENDLAALSPADAALVLARTAAAAREKQAVGAGPGVGDTLRGLFGRAGDLAQQGVSQVGDLARKGYGHLHAGLTSGDPTTTGLYGAGLGAGLGGLAGLGSGLFGQRKKNPFTSALSGALAGGALGGGLGYAAPALAQGTAGPPPGADDKANAEAAAALRKALLPTRLLHILQGDPAAGDTTVARELGRSTNRLFSASPGGPLRGATTAAGTTAGGLLAFHGGRRDAAQMRLNQYLAAGAPGAENPLPPYPVPPSPPAAPIPPVAPPSRVPPPVHPGLAADSGLKPDARAKLQFQHDKALAAWEQAKLNDATKHQADTAAFAAKQQAHGDEMFVHSQRMAAYEEARKAYEKALQAQPADAARARAIYDKVLKELSPEPTPSGFKPQARALFDRLKTIRRPGEFFATPTSRAAAVVDAHRLTVPAVERQIAAGALTGKVPVPTPFQRRLRTGRRFFGPAALGYFAPDLYSAGKEYLRGLAEGD